MNNYIKVKPSGGFGWSRPTEWLSIPAYSDTEQVFYGLHAVWDSGVNPCALLCNGTGLGYTVDWGDGTVTNHNFNTTAEKNYVYANLPANTLFRGYRQALVKITPRAGATITSLDLFKRHSSYNYAYSTGWLEKHVNFSTLTSMTTAWAQTVFMRLVENFYVKKHPNIGFGMFYNYTSLIQFTQKDTHTGSTDNIAYLAPASLRYVNLTVVSSVPQANNSIGNINNNIAVKNLTLTGSQPLTFYQDTSIQEYPDPANISVGGNCAYMFGNNYALKVVPAYNLSNVTNLQYWLNNTARQVVRIDATGAKVTHDISNQLLDATALNNYFTGLGTANTGATLTITGNPGSTTANTSIATAKGWTIIN